MADPAASRDLISEATFEEIVLPRIIDVTKYVKEQGALFMLHICGDTSMRVKQLLGSGIDIFSVDSIDLAAALATARGEFTIFGNLSPVNVLLNMTPEQVRKEADDRVATAGKTGGFILGTGCDVAPLTPMANLQSMMDAVFA